MMWEVKVKKYMMAKLLRKLVDNASENNSLTAALADGM